MDIKYVHTAHPTRPLLIFVPGFFTQPLIPGLAIDRSWDKSVAEICRTYDLSGCVIRWESGNILNLSMRSKQGSRYVDSALSAWQRVCSNAAYHIQRVSELINTEQRDIYLAGHSLGGSICLKIAEALPLKKLIVLAPAIEVDGVNYSAINRNVFSKPVVCFSRKDRVLSTLFTCGQASNNVAGALKSLRKNPAQSLKHIAAVFDSRSKSPALGLVGVPDTYSHMIKSGETQLRHMQYASRFKSLWDIYG